MGIKFTQPDLSNILLEDNASNLEIDESFFIKIDVQGYEENVLIGGKDTLKKAKILLIENSF
ncbi:FkbM family methyltransferase [Calothrix sp. NIES-3974]|uniref:FkbM family methyltransferase n=1 Tax=Calothrix sp. NIES-3974 TaxID=2005462 RepID=UPI000BBBF84D